MFRIDHIGIAVNELESAVAKWVKLLGVSRESVQYHKVEHARMDMAYIGGNGTAIELMSPWDEESTIYKFIEKRGAGLHHICFDTSDLEVELKKIADSGFPLVDKTPRESMGELIAFLHPKGFDGVLIEFKETKGSGD